MNVGRYFLYFCGQLGLMTLVRFFLTWIVRFSESPVKGETTEALVAGTTIGTVLLAFRIFDGVTDPVAGNLSDAWVRKGRERRKLLWFWFLVPSLGLVLCFLPGLGMSVPLRWLLLVVGMFLLFVGYTFYAIPYWSLIDDYGKDENERRQMSNLLGVGILAATALGSVASGKAIDAFGYRTATLVFAGPAALLMLLPIFARPPTAKTLLPKDDSGPGLIESVKVALKHRRFLATLFLFAGSQMSFTVLTAGSIYIVEYVITSTAPESDNSNVLAAFLATSFLAFAVVPWVSRRLGWERACMLASLLLAVVYGGTAFLGQGIIGTPLMTMAVLFALGGPMAAVLLGLEGEAVTDCANQRGDEMTAIYFGVYNLVIKCFNALALFLTSLLTVLIVPASKDGLGWGSSGARLIGPIAGGLLVLGVVAYFLARPKKGDEAKGEGEVQPGIAEAGSSEEPEA